MLRDVNIRDHILEVAQAGRVTLLDRLNDLSSTLGVMLPALGVHPFDSYCELCRIVGRLSIYGAEKRAPELPRYDHDNLGYIFHEVARLIRVLLSIRFEEPERVNFRWLNDIMLAELTSVWFDDRMDWYLGVDRKKAVSDGDCRKLLSTTHNDFVWKFGGNDKDIYKLNAVGLTLQDTDRVRVLPTEQHWTYWKVVKEPPHVFQAVSRNSVVAAFVRDRKYHAFQSAHYVNTSRFPVLKPNGEKLEFELALFGVRR
jgi:type VI secretion system protein ImpJ